jgi:hypothetical protein
MNQQSDSGARGCHGPNLLSPSLRHLISIAIKLTCEGSEDIQPALVPVSLEELRQQGLGPWIYYWVKHWGYENLLPAELQIGRAHV